MSNCFELRWKLFWSVCKLPRILSIKLMERTGGGGVKIFKINEKGGGVFFKIQIRGGVSF